MNVSSADSPVREDRPILVFGSPRSGTSLVSRLLNAHPKIGIPFESLIYDTFWPIRRHYGDLDDPGNAERLLRHMLQWSPVAEWAPPVAWEDAWSRVDRRDFHGLFRAVVTAWCDGQGKPVWGEKSPWHAFFWRALLEGFPRARVVHVIRDPRDATLSWKRARQGPRNAYVLARRWAGYMAVMDEVRAGWPADAYLECRYEELLADPEAECARLCEFLGEAFDPGMLAFHESSESYNTDPTNRANLARPIMQDNSGKWAEQFSEEELRWVEAVAGGRMRDLGYQPRNPQARVSSRERLRIKLMSNPVSRVGGMLQDRQGQREALQKHLFPVRARLRLG